MTLYKNNFLKQIAVGILVYLFGNSTCQFDGLLGCKIDSDCPFTAPCCSPAKTCRWESQFCDGGPGPNGGKELTYGTCLQNSDCPSFAPCCTLMGYALLGFCTKDDQGCYNGAKWFILRLCIENHLKFWAKNEHKSN